MTICVAFVTESQVFLIADSAVTAPGRESLRFGPLSSFGEIHQVDSEGTVEEGALKLLEVGSDGWAFAGDWTTIREVAEEIQRLSGRAPHVVMQALSTMLHDRSDVELEILWARNEDAQPILRTWDLEHGWLAAGPGFHAVAGVAQQYPELHATISRFAGACTNARIDDDAHRLMLAVAGIQSVLLREELIEAGMGGAVFGMMVGRQGVQWQADRLSVLISKKDLQSGTRSDDPLSENPPISNSITAQITFARKGLGVVFPAHDEQGNRGGRILLSLFSPGKIARLAREQRDRMLKVLNTWEFNYNAIVQRNDWASIVLYSGRRRSGAVFQARGDRFVFRAQIADILGGMPTMTGHRYYIAVGIVFADDFSEPMQGIQIIASPAGAGWMPVTYEAPAVPLA